MRWRVMLEPNFPRVAVIVLAILILTTLATAYAVVFSLPAERALAGHGAHAKATALARRSVRIEQDRSRRVTYEADLAWQDAARHQRAVEHVPISHQMYNEIQARAGSAVEIIYSEQDASARPLFVDDGAFRENSYIMARVGLGLLVIVTLLSVYFTRGRLREWRRART